MVGSRTAIEHVETTGGVQIDVPAEPGYLSLVRMLVHTLAQRRDLDDERIEDLVLAVSEACGWVVSSRLATDTPRPVQVRWSESDSGCVIEVTDTTSQGGDAPSLPAPEEVQLPADLGRAAIEGELSLPLVLALVDEVTSSAGPNGSSVHMTVGCGPWEGQPDL